MKLWLFNCEKIARMVSDSMDQDLPYGKRMGIRLHLMMCRYCTRFAQQLKQLRTAIQAGADDELPPQSLDDKVKQRMRRNIDENRQD